VNGTADMADNLYGGVHRRSCTEELTKAQALLSDRDAVLGDRRRRLHQLRVAARAVPVPQQSRYPRDDSCRSVITHESVEHSGCRYGADRDFAAFWGLGG
jgi:hypothetical protein